MNFYKGRVGDESPYRGWLVGHFINANNGPAHTNAIEVKYGVHKANDARTTWTTNETRTTLLIITKGQFEIYFDVIDNFLLVSGDYIVWGPGIEHKWKAITDVEAITVRWPSKT